MISLTLEMTQCDCPFIDTTDDCAVAFSATQWEFDAGSNRLETRMSVEGASREALDAGLGRLREHPHMYDCELISKGGAVAHLKTAIGETEAMGAIRANDGYITGPFHIEAGSERWHVGFDSEGVADAALSSLERDNDFTVVSRDAADPASLRDLAANADAARTLIEGCRALSATERRTIEAAVAEGYFETPRDATLETLADRFDVSKTAVSKNLRRGQKRVLAAAVEALDDMDANSTGETNNTSDGNGRNAANETRDPSGTVSSDE